jgi:hypothetical protein
VLLLHRLRRVLGIDAARAEEHQLPHARTPRGLDDVRLDGEVLVDELRRSGRVGENAADLRSSEEHVTWFFTIKKSLYRRGVGQIELGMGARDEVAVAAGAQPAHDRRAGEARCPAT